MSSAIDGAFAKIGSTRIVNWGRGERYWILICMY